MKCIAVELLTFVKGSQELRLINILHVDKKKRRGLLTTESISGIRLGACLHYHLLSFTLLR